MCLRRAIKNRHPLMKGFREGWQCEVYGLDEGGNAVIQKSTEEKALKNSRFYR